MSAEGADTRDTIYAPASGLGRAALAVLRVSGADVRSIVTSLAGKQPEPRRATLSTFTDPTSGTAIDRGLVVFFPGPASFTGEDCAEFHVHGGPAVVAALVRALSQFPGTRPAEAGEFTRRAFENGKLDLTEVEGLADLIAAETEAQRRQALRQMQGGLRLKAERWRAALLEASALLEAEIDFADEADTGSLARTRLAEIVAPVLADIKAVLAAGRAGERLREGLVVVIAGAPNVGKSMLLNALVQREAAIVSPIPGTTRDAIEVHLDIAGYPMTLIDTAGQRDARDAVEKIGIDRARARAGSADLILWLSEAAAPTRPDVATTAEIWPISTKIDLHPHFAGGDGLQLSAATGANLDLLTDKLAAFAQMATGGGATGLITRERHRKAFATAAAALERAQRDCNGPAELLAEECAARSRRSKYSLAGSTSNSVLGEIFARFCIGK